MEQLRIHIDLIDQSAVTFLSSAGKELGWEVILGAPGTVPPHILVTRPENLQRQKDLISRELFGPQILLWADPADVDPVRLLGVRVFAFIKPGTGLPAVKKVLENAAKGYGNFQEGFYLWHEMEERITEASVIMDLALELKPGMRIDDVLEKIVDYISEDLGYKIVSIMLVDEGANHLRINAARGLAEKIVRSSRMEIGKGVSGSVARTGRPLLVRDVENDPRFGKVRSHGRYSSKSLICVPLKVGDRVIGVLNANNKGKEGPLNEHDLRVLTVFAAHASVNIERARLHNSLEKQAKELKEAYEKLRAIDQVKSDFIINVSHEYRTPVTIILGYLEILKSSLTEEKHLEKITTTMEAANRLSSLIDDSTDLLRLDTGTTPFNLQIVTPHHFLEEAVREQWSRFGEKGVDLSLNLPEQLPIVKVDPEKMAKAIEKLLDNALKFTPQGGFTRVEAQPKEAGGVVIYVEDSGPGIGEGDMDRIFERFEQGGDIMTEKPEGTGLGLPIAKAIILRQGGSISTDRTHGTGCRFIVTLPAADAKGIEN